MTILVAPDGRTYETHDPAEVNTLVLGHGYKVADDQSTPDARDAVEPVPEPAAPVVPSTPDNPTVVESDNPPAF